MDSLIIWKTLILFFTVYFAFWIIFYTFQPDFLTEEDKAINGSRGTSSSDAYLSDRGRTTVFLYSLIPAFSAVFLYLLYSYYFVKTVKIKCSKNSKNLGECKISK